MCYSYIYHQTNSMVAQLQDLLPLISTRATEYNLESLYLSLMRLTHHLQTHLNVILLLAYRLQMSKLFQHDSTAELCTKPCILNTIHILSQSQCTGYFRDSPMTYTTLFLHTILSSNRSFFFFFVTSEQFLEYLILKCLCFTETLLI